MLHETPDPLYGVSLEPPSMRRAGYLVEQTNMRSDRLLGLVRRPPMLWHRHHTYSSTARPKHHRYKRNGKEYEVVINPQSGHLRAYIDGVEQVIAGEDIVSRTSLNHGYLEGVDHLQLQTIEDRTYLVNKARTVELTTVGMPVRGKQTSHINVTSASNYQDIITVRVSKIVQIVGPLPPEELAVIEGTFQIPSAGAASADYWRSTAKVAEEIADALINDMRTRLAGTSREHATGGTPAIDYPFIISVVGSTVSIHVANGEVYDPIVVEVLSDNKNIEVFNETVEDVVGIPRYAVESSVVKVQPDPSSALGVYYLQAVSASKEVGTVQVPDPNDHGTGNGLGWGESLINTSYLQECVWVETADPAATEQINGLQLPWELDMDTLTVHESSIEPKRTVGNEDTHPWPDFIGKRINDVAYMQKRLVFLSDGYASMTRIEKTGLPASFWHKSATTTLVTDPVSIAPSAVGVDALKYIQPHNKDLLITAANMQLKISGVEGITPQTVSMAPTTQYDVSTDVAPLALGADVYFTFPYTESTGLLKYTGQQNTQQDGGDIKTDHVQGYLTGKCRLTAGSPTLRMIAMVTDEADTIFINEYDDAGKYMDRQAWHKWTLPVGHAVVNLWFENDVLHIRTHVLQHVEVQSFRLARDTDAQVVYLDNQTKFTGTLDAEDDIFIVDDYPTAVGLLNGTVGYRVGAYIPLGVSGELQQRGIITADTFQWAIDDPHYSTDIDFVVGLPYRSELVVAGAAKYDDEGIPKQVKRVRHKRSLVKLVNSGDLSMDITESRWDTFTAVATTLGQTQIGRVTNTSRSVMLPYSGEPDVQMVRLFTDKLTPLNITKISWFGDVIEY